MVDETYARHLTNSLPGDGVGRNVGECLCVPYAWHHLANSLPGDVVGKNVGECLCVPICVCLCVAFVNVIFKYFFRVMAH